MSYDKFRKRSDTYIPAMNQMAGEILIRENLLPIFFQLPTKNEDMRQGIDMHVVTDKLTLAYRTRSNRYSYFYKAAFTLRNPNELNKVLAGTYSAYLLYALEHPTNPGQLESGILIDMREVGWQLREYPHLIEQASRHGDLIEFEFVAFPFPVVVGMSDLTHSDLTGWDDVKDLVNALTTGDSYSEHEVMQ